MFVHVEFISPCLLQYTYTLLYKEIGNIIAEIWEVSSKFTTYLWVA